MPMKFFQPAVPALPADINLAGKTVIVTGATAGIGLEASRQLLSFKVSNLVMAVRNTSKGEKIRQTLLEDPGIMSKNPNATVKVIQLDTENYSSIQRFISNFKAEFRDLHILVANAGIGTHEKETASTGHEKAMQVNYLSNVHLTLALLPTLEATADKIGEPTTVTWTGSRQYSQASLTKNTPKEEILRHVDTTDIDTMGRYGNSKLFCLLFQRELANHYSSNKVIINSFCPGFVSTGMTDEMPLPLRMVIGVMKAIRARPVHKGGAIAVNAAALAGGETHGRLLGDMELEEPFDFVKTMEGQRLQKIVWNETLDEMQGKVDLPSWAKKVQLL